MGSQRLCLGGHRDGTAAGCRVWHGAQGSQGLAFPGSGTAMHPGVHPPSSGMAVHPGDSTGKRGWGGGWVPKASRVAPSAHPRDCAPALHGPEGLWHTNPGAWLRVTLPDPARAVLCPILPCSGRIHPFECHWCPGGGSQHQVRASQGGEPGAPEPAGREHPCRWPGSRC